MLAKVLSRMDDRFLGNQAIKFGFENEEFLRGVHTLVIEKSPPLRMFLSTASTCTGDEYSIGAMMILGLIRGSSEAQAETLSWFENTLVKIDNDYSCSQINSITAGNLLELIHEGRDFVDEHCPQLKNLLHAFAMKYGLGCVNGALVTLTFLQRFGQNQSSSTPTPHRSFIDTPPNQN